MSNEIGLWCWVQGDELGFTFLVKINRDATVFELKKAIHAENPESFKDIDPKTLKLWKVF